MEYMESRMQDYYEGHEAERKSDDKRLTESQFSMQCAFIAKNAAAWAGDILTLPEHLNRPADSKTVARFTDEMRERLDRLDKWAGRQPS